MSEAGTAVGMEVAKMLLQEQASVFVKDNDGFTVLHWAAGMIATNCIVDQSC